MIIHTYGNDEKPSLLLLPGLGVSYELFLPLIGLLREKYYILMAEVDGFILGNYSRFTSIDDQAGQAIAYVKENLCGHLDLHMAFRWEARFCQGFWKKVFHSHYFDVLLDECRKVWPYGKGRAILDGYKDIYTHKLESVQNTDLHFWYGTKESFVAKPQVTHLLCLDPMAHIEVFPGMNHGQLLVDRPEEVGLRIDTICGIS